MVGRSGRSKACYTCRRRKKGCDLSVPCGQCLKAKLKCEGYATSLNVVEYAPPAPLPCSATARNLSVSAMESKYIEAFWRTYSPSVPRGGTEVPLSWVTKVHYSYTSSAVLKDALLALTLSRLGQLTKDRRLVDTGSGHYITALKELQKALDLKNDSINDNVIAACLLLCLYEILCAPTTPGHNWQRHSLGIANLLRLREPVQFQSGENHELFVAARHHIIWIAAMRRKSTYLNTSSWLNKPWTKKPKTSYDSILDIFGRIPRLFQDFDALFNSPASQPEAPDWESWLDACWNLDASLEKWRKQFVRNQVLKPPEARLDPDQRIPLSSSIDPNEAHTLALCWTCSIFIYASLRIVWYHTSSPLYLLPLRTAPLQYCHLIAHSSPYFTTAFAGEGIHLNFALCLGAAIQYMAVCGEFFSEEAHLIHDNFQSKEDDKEFAIDTRIYMFLVTLDIEPLKRISEFGCLDEGTVTPRVLGQARRWWGGGKPISLEPEVFPDDRARVARSEHMLMREDGTPVRGVGDLGIFVP